MTTTTTVRFTTAAFERSHGRKPSRTAWGTWAFQETTSDVAFEKHMVGEVAFFSGTLTEAKAQAKAAGLGAGTGIVAVLP